MCHWLLYEFVYVAALLQIKFVLFIFFCNCYPLSAYGQMFNLQCISRQLVLLRIRTYICIYVCSCKYLPDFKARLYSVIYRLIFTPICVSSYYCIICCSIYQNFFILIYCYVFFCCNLYNNVWLLVLISAACGMSLMCPVFI